MRCLFLITTLLLGGAIVHADGPIQVLTTLPDLREIVREVGARRVAATSLLTGPEDPHFVDAKPSFLRRAHDADLFVCIGLELEVGYEPLIREGARNPRIQRGQVGYLDASECIDRLGVPTGPIDRSMGDVHAGGNPHYWLDPLNWKAIGGAIVGRLKQIDPAGGAAYDQALATFGQKVDERIAGWARRLTGLRGSAVVTYHDDLPYLLARFGIALAGTLEPKPGVAPTAGHLASLIGTMNERQVTLILHTVYQAEKIPLLVAGKTGGRVARIAHMVGSVPEAEDLWSLMDFNVTALSGGRQ